MRSDLSCERVRAELSARLDDEGGAEPSARFDAHLADCGGCRHFEATQHLVRQALRLEVLPDAPDVTAGVMKAIARRPQRDVWAFRIRLASVAAIAAALVVLAATLPILERTPQTAQASEITQRVFAAARTLDSYRATFDIEERGWHADVPVRRFRGQVWYRAPERFRLRVRDLSAYPTGAWPSNDVDLVASPSRSWIREPYSCPPPALPGCAIRAGVEERTLVRRQPFDGTTRIPSDIVIPLETLVESDAFEVVGTQEVTGRSALHVVLTYSQAFPLVDALQAGGSWAPLLPLDRVDVWLDESSWFPLAFEVTRPGLDQPVLRVTTTSLREGDLLGASLFRAPAGGTIRDGGFSGDEQLRATGPHVPRYVAGLEPYRSGTTGSGATLVAFARGTTYLKITKAGGASRAGLDEPAEVVELRTGSFGLYRPAEPDSGRTIDLFRAETHVRLESNLRREQLLEVAASLPLEGAAPRKVRGGDKLIVRITPEQLGSISFARRPTELPGGYGPFSALLARDPRGADLTMIYLQSESGLEGSEIRVFQSSRVVMLPPISHDAVAVNLPGAAARWAPQRGELEWIGDDGIYRAIRAPSFDLPTVLGIARSLR